MPPVPFPWRCLALLNFAVVSAAPAVSLQDPAGQELILLSLAINAAMMGPFALVENEMVFQNPQAKRMEGRFSFVLPMDSGSAAMPSRLAMEIQGKLMEGEVVNRSKAQRVYREILHEARDPALLEQSAGNLFTARVFPIEPHAVVRLILSYAITLPMRELHRRLLIPLAGLPEIHNFTFSASVQSLSGGFSANCSLPTDGTNMPGLMLENGALGFSTSETHLVPSSDIQLDVWEPMAFTRTFSVDGGQLVSSFVLDSNSSSSQAFSPETWIIYIDTSASTADSFLVRIPVIEALLQQVPLSTHGVKVLAFDIEVTEVMEISGASAEEFSLLASSVSAQLRQRLPLGATDFEKLLRDVETRVPAAGQELGVLILSDCIATANERAEKRLQQLLTPGLGRVVEVAVIGSKFDSPLGSAIASAGAGRIVNIPLTSKDLSSVAAQAWLDLTKPMGQRGELVPGGGNAWIWPQAAFDLHDGDELVVFSGGEGLTLAAPELQLASGRMTAPTVQAAGAAFSSLLSREASRARLELLEAQRQLANSAAAKDIEFELVRLSEQSRVMTPHTALLVLETDEDYVRFGIPQDRLSPILTVSSTGVQLTERQNLKLGPLPTPLSSQELEGLIPDYNASNSTESCEVGQSECNLRVEDPDLMLQRVDSSSPDMGTSGAQKAFSVTWLLLLLLCWLDGICAQWADLETDADAIIAKHGPQGPTERLREVAGKYAAALWSKRQGEKLRSYCASWITWDPTNDLAFEYLSKAAQLLGEATLSLRAATSIAEVAPRSSEQLLRGAWLTLVLGTEATPWAVRFATRSLEEREDNVNTYRALAAAYWKSEDFLSAGKTYARALNTEFHPRYGDVKRIIREEAALLLRSIQDSSPKVFQDLTTNELKSVSPSEGESITLWISMSWLTDANDVDLHVIDPDGEECFYGHKSTKLGLSYYSDQTQGLGPEVVSVARDARPGRYRIGVKYFSSGAMGASRGTVLVRQMVAGKPLGDPIIEVFTLPADYSSVLPIIEVTVK